MILNVKRSLVILPILIATNFVYANTSQTVPSDKGGPRFIPWINDYSFLKDEENRMGTWQEKLNYIPIGQNTDNYLTIGGEVRYYAQYWEHVLLGVRDNDRNDSIQQRLRVYGDLHLGENLRVFTEVSDNWEFDAEFPTPSNYGAFDIQQFFLDYKVNLGENTSLNLRPGRFNMPLGSGILMGTRDGTNVWYTYDGLRTTLSHKDIKVDLFSVKPTKLKRGSFDDTTDKTRQLDGIYITNNLPNKDKADIYFYDMEHKKNVSYPNLIGEQDRKTYGVRYYGKKQDIDYDLEGIYQNGDMAQADISAYGLLANVGYNFSTPYKTRLGVRGVMLSGDDNVNDNKLKTFESPFPRTALFTMSGLLGLMNITQIEPSITVVLNPKLNFKASHSKFFKSESEDAIYYGGTGRPLALSNSSDKELADISELQINYLPNRNLNFNLSLSYLKAQDALSSVGGKDTKYAGFWTQFKF